ncbi:MAG: trypsin-like peptidase domain-containing protein [Candidatus Gracilibacteria bacterium]|jgi:S1-C subfamily serine protease
MSGAKKVFSVFVVVLLSVVFGAVSGAGTSMYLITNDYVDLNGESTNTTVAEVYNEESQMIAAYDKVAPAVVSIIALQDLNAYYNQYWGPLDYYYSYDENDSSNDSMQEVGGGTAFIISKDGMAVTNNHVIEDTTLEYVAYMDDGTEFDVEILDVDEANDLAILQLVAQDGSDDADKIGSLPYVEFGDSDSLDVGQMVLAIGNAFAEYENTTTAGIISATGREIVASGMYGSNPEQLDDLIQTDASINPGNSGGPLVNLNGQVIGVNTAVDSEAQGIGFAIPINDIRKIVDSYNQYGYIAHPYLGVMYVMVDAQANERLSLGVDYGAAIVGDPQSNTPAVVDGSPAADAGLQARDIILQIDDTVIDAEHDLKDIIMEYAIGDEITLKVWRDSEEIEVKVTLGQSGSGAEAETAPVIE